MCIKPLESLQKCSVQKRTLSFRVYIVQFVNLGLRFFLENFFCISGVLEPDSIYDNCQFGWVVQTVGYPSSS